MPSLGMTFNPQEHPDEGWQLIPKGEYVAIVTASDVKETRNGRGEYLELRWRIVGAECNNRVLFSRFNIKNQNTQAEEIARRELAQLCCAAGITTTLEDSEALHDIPVCLVVDSEKRKDTGEETNRIRRYKPASSRAVEPGKKTSKPWGNS